MPSFRNKNVFVTECDVADGTQFPTAILALEKEIPLKDDLVAAFVDNYLVIVNDQNFCIHFMRKNIYSFFLTTFLKQKWKRPSSANQHNSNISSLKKSFWQRIEKRVTIFAFGSVDFFLGHAKIQIIKEGKAEDVVLIPNYVTHSVPIQFSEIETAAFVSKSSLSGGRTGIPLHWSFISRMENGCL